MLISRNSAADLREQVSMPPPQPPLPPKVYEKLLGLHLVLTLCTLGLWMPFWVFAWWTVDARNVAEQQRHHREWHAYQQALAEWRWQQLLGGRAPTIW